MKKQTDTDKAKAAGLSRSQLNEARAEGIDVDSPEALKVYRGRTNTRSDSRNDPLRDKDHPSESMTLDDIETALRAKGLSPNEARTLKTQLEGLKAAIALRQQMNQLLTRHECKENQAKTAHALNGMIRAMENEIPSLCYGKSLGEAKGLVKEKTRELQKALSDAQSEFWKGHIEC